MEILNFGRILPLSLEIYIKLFRVDDKPYYFLSPKIIDNKYG